MKNAELLREALSRLVDACEDGGVDEEALDNAKHALHSTAVRHPATVEALPCESNGHCYVVRIDHGERYNLRGIGTPNGKSVGDRGFIRFVNRTAFGLWMWEDR